MRYTPEIINKLGKNEIFVFGSNESGYHGGGAALVAHEKFGAIYHQGFGPQGRCFAIPTKDWKIQTLPLASIHAYIQSFLRYASWNTNKTFLFTKIGCGLAGLTIEDIAPLVSLDTMILDIPGNVVLPKEFEDWWGV